MSWKVTAIIFIILFSVETCFVVWGVYIYNQEVKNTNFCYYEICGEYPEAYYENDVCSCYDYDVLGELKVVKTKVVE